VLGEVDPDRDAALDFNKIKGLSDWISNPHLSRGMVEGPTSIPMATNTMETGGMTTSTMVRESGSSMPMETSRCDTAWKEPLLASLPSNREPPRLSHSRQRRRVPRALWVLLSILQWLLAAPRRDWKALLDPDASDQVATRDPHFESHLLVKRYGLVVSA